MRIRGAGMSDMAAAGTVALRPSRRLAALSWRRLFAHSSFVAGQIIVTGVIAAAAFAPTLAPFDPIEQAFTSQLLAPSRAHPFGTDEFGRDIFSRVIYGARIALVVGVVADGIAALLGVVLGVVSATSAAGWMHFSCGRSTYCWPSRISCWR